MENLANIYLSAIFLFFILAIVLIYRIRKHKKAKAPQQYIFNKVVAAYIKEELHNKRLQLYEDNAWRADIERIAWDMWRQLHESKLQGIYMTFVIQPPPRKVVYTLYHETSAEFKEPNSIDNLIKKRYKEICEYQDKIWAGKYPPDQLLEALKRNKASQSGIEESSVN